MDCKKISIPKTYICAGDRKHKIKFYDRNITAPTDVDFGIDLDNVKIIWCAMKTVKGVTIFDGMNIERDVTHRIYMNYREDITQELQAEYKGKYYEIFDVIDINEEGKTLELPCSVKGSKSKESSK